mgnify:CR=1 FL=1
MRLAATCTGWIICRIIFQTALKSIYPTAYNYSFLLAEALITFDYYLYSGSFKSVRPGEKDCIILEEIKKNKVDRVNRSKERKKESKMLGAYVENVRKNTPLVHNITNYVTVNDVANVLLACGGSPIMSDEPEDVEDITAICGGLNINIGTLNQNSIKAMSLAGKKAQELGHVLLLDPVGAGASASYEYRIN